MAGRWRRFVVRPLVWMVAALAAAIFGIYLFLGSQLARTRAQALLEARLGEALGRKVTIERVDFSVVPLWIVLEGVTIAGDRTDAPPFARLAKAEVDAEWHGVRERVLELTKVSLSGLELALEFRADGTDNLPRPPKGRGGAGLAVRLGGLYVEDGRVRVDEETAPFALAAEAVDLRANGLAGGQLDAAVAAQHVELRLPGAQPFDTALAAHARLQGDQLEILNARLSAPDLTVVTKGSVGLSKPTRLALNATAEGSGALLDRLGWLHGELAGPFRFDGDFTLRSRAWNLRGALASPALDLLGFRLTDLSGRVEGSPRAVRLALERASYAGGSLAGEFGVSLARPFRSTVELEASGVEVQKVLDQFDLPVRDVRGVAGGPFRYEFDLLAAAKGNGSGTFALTSGGLDGAGAGVEGKVDLRLAAGELELPSVVWHSGAQSVTGSGRLALAGRTGRFELAVASEELGGIVRMLPFLPAGELWVPTGGTAKAQVELDLAPGSVRAGVELEAGALESPGVRAERVVGRLNVAPGSASIESLSLFRPGGQLSLSGTVPLEEPGAPATVPLALNLIVSGWPIVDAAPWLPFAVPIKGDVSGTIALGGSFEALHGQAELALDDPEVAGLDARRLTARFDWDPKELRLADARLELAAGAANASGTVALDTERLALQARAPSLALDRAPFDALGGGRLTGRAALAAEIGGTLSLPDLKIDGTFSELALAGERLDATPGAGEEATRSGRGAPRLAAHWVEGKLDAELELPGVGRIEGGGALKLDSAARLEFQLSSDRLDRLVALATGATVEQLEGSVEARVTLDLPIDGKPGATVDVPEIEFNWRGKRIHSLEPIRARLDGDALSVDSFYVGVKDAADELFLAGVVHLEGDPRLDLHLQGDIGAELVRPWIGDLDVGGRLSLLADLEGTATAPALRGQGEWSGGRYVPGVLPHVFDRGQALLLLYPDAVVLDHLTGHFASGEIDASGRIDLKDGAATAYRFELAARRLNLRWPPGWQTRGDAELTMVSTAAGRQISGMASFDRLYYFQDIDLSPTQLIERLLARSRVALPETDELLSSTALNISLRAPESIRVKNNVADLTASAELALKGSLARPVVFGEVRTVPGGRVTYSGNRYEVERGLLSFADSTRIDPQLDIVARTKVDEYDVSLILGGPLSRPVVSFTSDPPLADLEILGLLTTGAAPTGALFTDRPGGVGAPADASATGAVGAEAMLYGQAASLVGARVGKLFGFDQVRVEPLTSGDAVSSARVTVGKRFSRRLFVTYSIDPTSTAQDILQAEYRVSDRLTLVLTQNGNESFSVDARWESRF